MSTPPWEPGPAGAQVGGPDGAPAGSAYPAPATSSAYPSAYPTAPAYPATPGGYPGAAPWGTPATPPTDGFAIASLVVALSSPLTSGLGAPVGIGLGIAALSRIRRSGARGRGMAIAGIVIGSVMVVAAIVLAVVLLVAGIGTAWQTGASSDGSSVTATDPGAGDDGATTDGPGSGTDQPGWSDDSTTVPPFELTVQLAAGQCLAEHPATYDLSDAVPVDCATTHDSEVIALVTLGAPVSTDLTTPDPAFDAAYASCTQQISALLGGEAVDSVGFADLYYPHPDQWDAGAHDAYCVLVTDAWVSGSLTTGTLGPAASADV